MSLVNFTQIETLACLMNGCHIVWCQPNGPGLSTYKVYRDGGRNPDKCLGRLTHATVSSLWSRGFLRVDGDSSTDKYGSVYRVLRLDVPSFPAFVLDDEVQE